MVQKATNRLQGSKEVTPLSNPQAQRVVAQPVSIYEGRKGIKDVLQAGTSGQISNTQARQLLDSVNTVNSTNRTIAVSERAAAAAEGRKENAVYDTMEFKSGKEYINRVLRSQPTLKDPLGEGTKIEQMQRAEAVLEFTQRAAATTKEDLPKLREEVTDRFLKRRAEASQSPLDQYQGRIRYNTPTETAKAFREGKLSPEQLQTHLNYFRLLNHQGKTNK